MSELRKAAEQALDIFGGSDWNDEPFDSSWADKANAAVEALRQALAHEALDRMVAENERLGLYDDGPAVKSYCGGKPNYCTPDVDAVNMTQKRVDETAKREHEPVAWRKIDGDGFNYCDDMTDFPTHEYYGWEPLYTAPPISDYHEGWEEGYKAATREHEPFIYVREDNERPFGGYEHCSEADAGAFPVYTAPMIYTPPPKREWVGLTDEEINDWFFQRLKQVGAGWRLDDVIKAVEAKLKDKNGG